MAILGSVPVTGFVAPTDPSDVYPSHDSYYGKGGYREVLDLIERDSIPEQRRTVGMLVYVQSSDQIYKLSSGITNADWVIFLDSSPTSGANVLSLNISANENEIVEVYHNLGTTNMTIQLIDSDFTIAYVRMKLYNDSIHIGPFTESFYGKINIAYK
jgi:hypothetical protein